MSKTNLLTFMFLSLLRYRLLLRLFVSHFICAACGDVYSLTAYISLKVEGYVWKCLSSSFSRLLPNSSFPPGLLVSENATIRFLFNFPYTSFCSFVDIATYRFESLQCTGKLFVAFRGIRDTKISLLVRGMLVCGIRDK